MRNLIINRSCFKRPQIPNKHSKPKGFTIIELIVVITVMGILLVLGVVNLSGTQADARDAKRKADAEAIAMYLETFYSSGTDNDLRRNRYPSAEEIKDLPTIQKTLRDIDTKILFAPDSKVLSLTGWYASGGGVLYYNYLPHELNGYPCYYKDKICTRFELEYITEKDGASHIIKSKNQ